MVGKFNDFREKTLKEIRLWAWAAAVLPLSGLAAIFFVWSFGTSYWFNIAMIVGETTMFAIAVTWWWWALYTMKKLINQWDETRNGVSSLLENIGDIKAIVSQRLPEDK